jgi:hypothetical protein
MSLKTYFMLCIIAFTIGSGISFIWPTNAQTSSQQPLPPSSQPATPHQAEDQDPSNRYIPGPKKLRPENIILSYKPDIPIEITSIKEEFSDGRDVITVKLTNTSAKKIRAEGIKILAYDKFDESRHNFTLFYLAHHSTSKSFLKPGATIERVLSESFLEAEKVLIVVDFIEFEDGQVWGPNQEGYADNIKGQRAGMVAALEKLISMVNEKGIAVLSKEQQITIATPNTDSRSKRWKEGFERGVRSVQSSYHAGIFENNLGKAKDRVFNDYSELKSIVERDDVQQ